MTVQIHIKYDNGEAIEVMMPMRRVHGSWQLPPIAWDRVKEAIIKPVALQPMVKAGKAGALDRWKDGYDDNTPIVLPSELKKPIDEGGSHGH